MKKFLENFIEHSGLSNGLTLLDRPTGVGKTHDTDEYIYEYTEDNDRSKGQKVFLSTRLLINLPEDDIKRNFEEGLHPEDFDKKFLKLESNVLTASRFLLSDKPEYSEARKLMPKEIISSPEYKRFKSYIDINANVSGLAPEDSDGLQNEITDRERDLRYSLKRHIYGKYKTLDERREAVTHGEYRWVSKMYPSALIEEKQIILLSIAKMAYLIDPIYKASFHFYSDNLIKGSVIFLDESDDCKKALQSAIIKNGVGHEVDLVALEEKIYLGLLKSDKFPSDITKESSFLKHKHKDSKTDDWHLVDKLDRFKYKVQKSHEEYNLDRNFKTREVQDKKLKAFLLYDTEFNSVTEGTPVVKFDEESGLNLIDVKKKENKDAAEDKPQKQLTPEEKREARKGNMHFILGNLKGIISMFRSWLKETADNYMHLINERRNHNGNNTAEYTLEQAVHTILNQFPFSDDDKKYFEMPYQDVSSMDKLELSSAFDDSFYMSGFSIFDFRDSPDSNMKTGIINKEFFLTPEKILLSLADKAKVVCVSATASNSTPLTNFDIGYIKTALGDNFYVPREEDKKNLDAEFQRATAGYKDVNIHVVIVDERCPAEYGLAWWRTLNVSEDVAEAMWKKVKLKVPDEPELDLEVQKKKIAAAADLAADVPVDNEGKTKFFKKERYFCIVSAYEKYGQTAAQALLCYLNKYPKADDNKLDINLIRELCSMVSHDETIAPEQCITVLTSDKFEDQKKNVQNELTEGKRRFIISVYQSTGTGQNMQYAIPQSRLGETVRSNDFERSKD
ncbi:MAG: hypothetical protein LUD51_05235 [Clostridia bacterium]|nr:hypothetical protein [Clostridia bacterium]